MWCSTGIFFRTTAIQRRKFTFPVGEQSLLNFRQTPPFTLEKAVFSPLLGQYFRKFVIFREGGGGGGGGGGGRTPARPRFPPLLLFLLYINNLPNCSKKLLFRIFADDTNIFYSSNNINELEKQLTMNSNIYWNTVIKTNFLLILRKQIRPIC
jgi:hypothetical protein